MNISWKVEISTFTIDSRLIPFCQDNKIFCNSNNNRLASYLANKMGQVPFVFVKMASIEWCYMCCMCIDR